MGGSSILEGAGRVGEYPAAPDASRGVDPWAWPELLLDSEASLRLVGDAIAEFVPAAASSPPASRRIDPTRTELVLERARREVFVSLEEVRADGGLVEPGLPSKAWTTPAERERSVATAAIALLDSLGRIHEPADGSPLPIDRRVLESRLRSEVRHHIAKGDCCALGPVDTTVVLVAAEWMLQRVMRHFDG